MKQRLLPYTKNHAKTLINIRKTDYKFDQNSTTVYVKLTVRIDT